MKLRRKFSLFSLIVFSLFIFIQISFSDISQLGNLSTKKIDGSNSKPAIGHVFRTGGVGLHFRTGPWGKIMNVLPDGKEMRILGREGDWYRVDVDGKKGYVHSNYISKDSGKEKKVSGSMYVNVPFGGALNVRTGPWGKILRTARRGEKVQIIGKKGDWYKVKIDGRVAYMHSAYLTRRKLAKNTRRRNHSSKNSKNVSRNASNVGKGWGGTPCKGVITSPYGWRTHPITHRRSFHRGIDIGAPAGTPCKSLGPGKVIYAGWNDGYGNLVKIKHDNGLVTYYGHLKSFNVKVGQRVGQNSIVAFVNSTGMSTGNHLHFEVRRNGKTVNPRSVKGVKL